MSLSRMLSAHPDIRDALDEGMQAILRRDPPPEGKEAVLALAHELKRASLRNSGSHDGEYNERDAEQSAKSRISSSRRVRDAEDERRAKSRQRSRRASAVGATEYTLPGASADIDGLGMSTMEQAAAAAVAAMGAATDSDGFDGEAVRLPGDGGDSSAAGGGGDAADR